MCDPVTAAVVVGVTTLASTAAGIVQTNQMAKRTEKAIKAQAAVAREETRAEATAELFDQMRAARREAGRTKAAAGEAGVNLDSGSIEALLMDSAMQTELKNDRTLANMESRHNQNVAEANAALSRIEKVSPIQAGIQLAAAGASAWSGVQNAKIKKTGGG